MEGGHATEWTVILTAAITAIPPTLTALAAFIASLRNGRKADAASKKAEFAAERANVAAKQAEILAETKGETLEVVRGVKKSLAENTKITAKTANAVDHVLEQTNGGFTELKKQLEQAQERVTVLEAELSRR